MKVTIDTKNKTIEIEEKISIKDLKKSLKSILADEIDDYTIVPKIVTNTVKEYVYPPYYVYPYQWPYYTPSHESVYCGSGTVLTSAEDANTYIAGTTYTLDIGRNN